MATPIEHANGLIRARRILTLVPGVEGDAIWWQSGRIRTVGRAADLERKVPTRVPRFDFPNALVTPGFVDGHTHFATWAQGRWRVQLFGAATRKEALDRVAQAEPSQGWILGQGWDAHGWDERPNRWALDSVQTLPVYLDSLDSHAAWLSSAALQAAGITRDTPDPFAGRIVRDANGEPTGLLLERAVNLVTPYLPPPPIGQVLRAVREAQVTAHQMGITGIHDVEGPDALAAFRALETEGSLRLRVLFHPPVARLGELINYGVRSAMGTEWLTLGGVKMFLDGSLGSRTAWMLERYESAGDCGIPLTTEPDARQAMETAAGAGLACVVHAIGDAAVRCALDLMTALPKVGVPHRIEHFQCVHPEDLDRAALAGIAVSMQPAHMLTDIPLAERQWGARSRGAYAIRSLHERGTLLVFGSDVPVTSLDPRPGVVAAMTRTSADGGPNGGWYPDEKIGFETAVAAYTIGAARAASLEGRRGVLAAGRDADMVVWDVDPAIEQDVAEAFGEAKVRLTVVGGEPVMQA